MSDWPVTPIPPGPEEIILRLVEETVATGCPPKAAIKWWAYILDKI